MRAVTTLCFAITCILSASAAFADGPDKQTPEEIAAANAIIERDFRQEILPSSLTRASKKEILGKYGHLDPQREVPTQLLEDTVVYFDQNKNRFPVQNYITVIDLGRKSDRQRFWLIDMTSGKVEAFWVIHGWGSDENDDGVTESFGNVVNSGKSSLGFIRTAEIYSGKFGRSVRLDGLSKTNTKVRERAIVLHGFAEAYQKPVKQGLGWGCPALDFSVKDSVIDKVAEGSLMYIGDSR